MIATFSMKTAIKFMTEQWKKTNSTKATMLTNEQVGHVVCIRQRARTTCNRR